MFFPSRRRHTRCLSDWSSDVCSSDLVAASSLPANALPVGVIPANDLRVGRLPVIFELVAPPAGSHLHRPIHPQCPAADIDLVRPVVECLAGAPVPEPVPVVVDQIVVID